MGDMGSRPKAVVDAQRRLARFVSHGTADESDLDMIVDAGLASIARRELAGGQGSARFASDPRLVKGSLAARASHVSIRAAVLPLLAALRHVGIEVLLFKGFYLAEFVYDEPGDRPYSDVDVAVRAPNMDLVTLASAVATAAEGTGWRVEWRLGETVTPASRYDEKYDGHELAQLEHTRYPISMDVHMRVAHNGVDRQRAPRLVDHITDEVWRSSNLVSLEGVEVRAPSFVDSALVGLILSRSWSHDRHALRPHDYLDLENLMLKGCIDHEQLFERAAELGARATLRTFLRRCDPTRKVFDLVTPRPLARARLDLAMMPDRAPFWLVWTALFVGRLPKELVVTAKAFPHVAATIGRWRAGSPTAVDAADSPESHKLGSSSKARPSWREWRTCTLGVRRGFQLLGLTTESHPLLTVAALIRVAAANGYEVGLIEDEQHMWLHSGGQVLPFEGLGAPRGMKRGGWPKLYVAPRPTVATRLRRIGLRGLLLRIEALLHLRAAQARLSRSTFAEAHRRPGVLTKLPLAFPRGTAVEVGQAVEAVTRFVPGAMCVAQSLAGQEMLRRRKATSRIHFGFRRLPEGKINGHAWLEVEGQVVTGDEGLDQFTRTATFE